LQVIASLCEERLRAADISMRPPPAVPPPSPGLGSAVLAGVRSAPASPSRAASRRSIAAPLPPLSPALSRSSFGSTNSRRPLLQQ
jgi:hypothetical protein